VYPCFVCLSVCAPPPLSLSLSLCLPWVVIDANLDGDGGVAAACASLPDRSGNARRLPQQGGAVAACHGPPLWTPTVKVKAVAVPCDQFPQTRTFISVSGCVCARATERERQRQRARKKRGLCPFGRVYVCAPACVHAYVRVGSTRMRGPLSLSLLAPLCVLSLLSSLSICLSHTHTHTHSHTHTHTPTLSVRG
jgi:hypothetical protein